MLRRYTVTVAGKPRIVELEELDGGAVRVFVDGIAHELDVRSHAGQGSATYRWLDGSRVVNASVDGAPLKPTVTVRGVAIPVEVADARQLAAAAAIKERPRAAGPLTVRAPMPGRVAKVLVKAGDAVTSGKAVVVVEAMKMENEIRAPRDGTVREVRCAEGVAVDAGQELVILE